MNDNRMLKIPEVARPPVVPLQSFQAKMGFEELLLMGFLARQMKVMSLFSRLKDMGRMEPP